MKGQEEAQQHELYVGFCFYSSRLRRQRQRLRQRKKKKKEDEVSVSMTSMTTKIKNYCRNIVCMQFRL